MDKRIVGLIGAVTALASADPSHAATSGPQALESAMQVSSYADLLKPIPNAVEALKASDAVVAQATLLAPAVEGDATVQDAQYYYHHHHHHHHHYGYAPRYVVPFYHHHHHGYYRPFYHHHHHHHHYYQDNGY